tara:strand:- start:31758 stop:32684 length:927 start_codon:yes stop_codon:yes gene_type:complete
MTLDADAKALLDKLIELAPPPYHSLTPEEARAAQDASREAAAAVPPDIAAVEELSYDGPAGALPIRLYRPHNRREKPEPFLVFFHGGGWVIGSLDSHDILCRKLALGTGLTVLSVEYHLAPEHKFPTCIEDASAAVEWIFAHAESLRLNAAEAMIGGDSAGAAIATVMAIFERDAGKNRFKKQLLIYPVTDLTMSRKSHDISVPGLPVTGETMRWFRQHYLTTEKQQTDWRASPFFVPDVSGLPPTFVATAGYDPLWDEGDAYARRLSDAGVPVTLRHYPGQIHGFVTIGAALPTSEIAIQDCVEFLK